MVMRIHAVFHLNLYFSSIAEERRPEVLERCYAPLFSMADDLGVPLGFEASGLTLEALRELDPSLLARLRKLTESGRCEFLGSGYAQLIGPLVPPIVNRHNLRLGQDRVEALLGHRPTLAFVNEQAWSAGLVSAYQEAGFQAVMMEWNNAARNHPEWPAEMRFRPQRAAGVGGESLPLVWNDSIAFQKLQRYAHHEMSADAWFDWLAGLAGPDRCLAIYGGDAEIFDHRPNRYAVEPTLEGGEWDRLRELFARLSEDPRFEWVAPSDALADAESSEPLELGTAVAACPVKKQPKYNLSRWAVSGRSDLEVNSRCHRLAQNLEAETRSEDRDWQELCRLWSSDFRTHITQPRWTRFLHDLDAMEARIPESTTSPKSSCSGKTRADWRWDRQADHLQFESDQLRVVFNIRRGLAIESLCWKEVSEKALLGTVPHGVFDDIAWAADYYTGHFVCQPPGEAQVTDLSPIEPFLENEDASAIGLTGTVPTALGPVEKRWVIDLSRGRVGLSHRFFWAQPTVASLRVGHVTLLPDAFDRHSLCYRTPNGGKAETFALGETGFDHGAAVSSRVSASDVLGLPSGWIEIGDDQARVRIETCPEETALAGLLKYQPFQNSFFLRLSLSAREVDDTRIARAEDGLQCRSWLSARRC